MVWETGRRIKSITPSKLVARTRNRGDGDGVFDQLRWCPLPRHGNARAGVALELDDLDRTGPHHAAHCNIRPLGSKRIPNGGFLLGKAGSAGAEWNQLGDKLGSFAITLYWQTLKKGSRARLSIMMNVIRPCRYPVYKERLAAVL